MMMILYHYHKIFISRSTEGEKPKSGGEHPLLQRKTAIERSRTVKRILFK